MPVGAPEEYLKVTPRHLRSADEMCRRRLACELANQRGNPSSSARFAVSNRVSADARLAHTQLGPPDRRAFVVPADLFPEQQRLYEAAVTGYMTLFGDVAARAVDTPFDLPLDDIEVRLVGEVGIALETDAGCEIRVLRIGEPGHARPLLDDVDLRVAVLRAAGWADGRPLRVVVAELLGLEIAAFDVDVEAGAATAREWVVERTAQIRALATDPEPRASTQCLGCGFVNGCRAHRSS